MTRASASGRRPARAPAEDKAHNQEGRGRCCKCGFTGGAARVWSPPPSCDGSYEIDYDYCKGCGLCGAECPCGAIEMEPEPS